MPPTEFAAEHVIADPAALRALYKPVDDLAARKCLPALDRYAREFIERAPFVCLGTMGAEGKADVSPRGDPAGFVQILDDRTIAIPDRPGNNRLDSLENILADPTVALLFLIPGFDDTLRVNGTAQLVTDPALLAPMAVNGRVPKLAIVVRIRSVFLHCAKALRRSRLWDPDARQDRRGMPSLAKMILDQTGAAPDDPAEQDKIDAELEETYRRTMY